MRARPRSRYGKYYFEGGISGWRLDYWIVLNNQKGCRALNPYHYVVVNRRNVKYQRFIKWRPKRSWGRIGGSISYSRLRSIPKLKNFNIDVYIRDPKNSRHTIKVYSTNLKVIFKIKKPHFTSALK